MATYFVKNGGSDGANGLSDGNAWATINKVNTSSFSPGDIIQLRRGDVWREQMTFPSAGSTSGLITLTHYGGAIAAPLLNGADVLSSWTDDGGNVWRATLNTQPQIVMFAGQLGIPVASKAAIDQSTEWFWESNLLYVYGTSNPNSFYGTVEASVRPTDNEALINFNGKSWVEANGIAVRHSQNTGIKNYAAGAGQAGRHVRNCEVLYTADGGLCIYADNFDFTDTILERNEVGYTNLRNGGDGSGPLEGITTMHADGYEIAHNTVHHCYEEGICAQTFSKNGRIHHNIVHTKIGTIQFRPGIYVPDGAENVEVDHNTVYGYSQTGCKALQLNCEGTDHTTNNTRWHHNVAWDCDFGMSIDCSGGGTGVVHSNAKIYNNTFYRMTAYGIAFNSNVLDRLGSGNEIKNNIFDTSGSLDIIDFSTGNYGIANFTIDTNFFVTGVNTETTGSNAVVAASPLFMNAAGRDFRLQPLSPCVDAGVVIAGITDGYVGSNPDIGALEFDPTPRRLAGRNMWRS